MFLFKKKASNSVYCLEMSNKYIDIRKINASVLFKLKEIKHKFNLWQLKCSFKNHPQVFISIETNLLFKSTTNNIGYVKHVLRISQISIYRSRLIRNLGFISTTSMGTVKFKGAHKRFEVTSERHYHHLKRLVIVDMCRNRLQMLAWNSFYKDNGSIKFWIESRNLRLNDTA